MSKSRRRLRQFKPGDALRHRRGQPVSAGKLRQLFADGQILEKVASGEYTVKVLKSSHPSPPLADEPECTQSQLLGYSTAAGQEIARAHQYLRTDQTIGASGKPGPKEVLHEGVLYYIDL